MSWKLLPDKKIQLLSFAQIFSSDECDGIIRDFKGADHHSQRGNEFFFSSITIDPSIFPMAYERVTSVVLDSAINNYGFKLHSIPALYYVEFDRSCYMNWSMDLTYSGRETAKLSVHIPLNEDYEPGDFVVRTPYDTTVSPKAGVVTIFPSFLASKQESPKAGIKRAILGTVAGLPFS